MNRELDFRVWTGAGYEYDVMVGKFGAFYVNPGIKGDGLDEHDSASLTSFNTKFTDNCIVEQFTGLYDINNVPIYEGDIVDIELHDGTKNRMVVKWHDIGFMLFDINGTGFWRVTHTPIEVVGNIHEGVY